MKWVRKNVPQKIRWVTGMLFIFPLVALILAIKIFRCYFLSLYDISRDAFNGEFENDFDGYLIDRIGE
jgi:hypothetical protein